MEHSCSKSEEKETSPLLCVCGELPFFLCARVFLCVFLFDWPTVRVSAERGRVFLTLSSSSLVLPQTSFSLPLRFLWPPRASSLPPLPLSRRRTAEGPGPCRWGRRSGEVGWVSCSPFLPFYRFMGAQSFSKYLPFPLYCGRLMAFDVRGWRCRGSGCRAGGRSGWIGGDPVRVHVCEPPLLMAPHLPPRRGQREQGFLHLGSNEPMILT